MRVITNREPFNFGDTFNLWGLGDFHVSAKDFDEPTLRQHVALIEADPNARWIGMGDYGNSILHRDKRWDQLPINPRYYEAQFAEGGILSEEVYHVCELLEPIASKCIGFAEGNHETAVRKRYDRSLASEIAKALNLRSQLIGYQGFVRWQFHQPNSTRTYVQAVIHVGHGWQGGRRKGAKLNQIEVEKAQYPDADIILRGHSHEHIGQVFGCFRPGQQVILESHWVYANTGTYKLGRVDSTSLKEHHDTWESQRMFPHKTRRELGPPIIHVTPREKDPADPNQSLLHLLVTV